MPRARARYQLSRNDRSDCPRHAGGCQRAARLLRLGELVAFPTETVYGLGADATNERAVAAIFCRQGPAALQPADRPCAGVRRGRAFAVFDARARGIAVQFWPGPLTLVLPRRAGAGLSLLASAGLDTVALRTPAHPVARALLRADWPADRRPVGESLRSREPDRGRACRRRTRRSRNADPRCRPHPGRFGIQPCST